MAIQNYSLASYPLFQRRLSGINPEGYSYVTPLIHAVATRVAYANNGTITAAFATAMGATSANVVASRQGIGNYLVMRFANTNPSSTLIAFAGLANSTDAANAIRLTDYYRYSAVFNGVNPDRGFPMVMTSVYNNYNNTYKNELVASTGATGSPLALRQNVSVAAHGYGCGYAMMLLQNLLNVSQPTQEGNALSLPSVSLFSSPLVSNIAFSQLITRSTDTRHYFLHGDRNVNRPLPSTSSNFYGSGGLGARTNTDIAYPFVTSFEFEENKTWAIRQNGRVQIDNMARDAQNPAIPLNPVNGWAYPSTIEGTVNALFGRAIAPDGSTVTAQLQTINNAITALPYTMAGTNPTPSTGVLPTNNIAPQVQAPLNQSNTPIAGLTPAPTIVGGQINMRAVNLASRTANKFQGYDRRLMETLQQAAYDLQVRDQKLRDGGSRVPSNGQEVFPLGDDDLQESLGQVLANMEYLLSINNK